MTFTDGVVSLHVELAERLIRRMTDGLVNIVDKTGEFLLHRELPFQEATENAN